VITGSGEGGLLNEPSDVARVAAERGFCYFTTADGLQAYVESEILEPAAAQFGRTCDALCLGDPD
jgi:hypothetical protein